MKRVINSFLALVFGVSCLVGCESESPTGGTSGSDFEEFGIVFDKNVIMADGRDAVNFKVYYKGEDVTSSALLYRVTGGVVDEKLQSMSFATSTPGSYSFWASYDAQNKTSKTVTINATELEIPVALTECDGTQYKRRTFFHQHTGADCQFCPYMAKLLREVINDEIKDKVVLAGIRNYNSSEAGFASIPNPAGSWPYLQIDYEMSRDYETPVESMRALVNDITASPAVAGISANPVYYPDSKKIVCRVAVKAAVAGEYNVGLWLMQDNYYATQQFRDPTKFDDSYHYHNNCVRVAESKYLGAHVGFPLGYMPAGETREWVFLIDVKDDWWTDAYAPVKLSDLHLAAFVTAPYVDGKDGKVYYKIVNVIDFPYNQPKAFDCL